MINKVINTINKYNMIDSKDKVVVGVSGGPDSICMLYILNELRTKLNFEIYVAHINHMIRDEADEETEYVKKICDKLNVECFIKKVDIKKEASLNKLGTEEMGRKVRYDFFNEVLEKVGANKIATAHNLNDNAETVLMNIIRGTGISGLKGILPVRENKFIRPIIECQRCEIEEYCEINKLEPKIDKSNFENIYTRNKIRNLLIPEIRDNYNPNIINSLNNLSNIARQENDFIDEYICDVMNELTINNCEINLNDVDKNIINGKQNFIVLDLKKFNKKSYFIKNEVILKTIYNVLGDTQGIEKKNIEDIVTLCSKNIGNKYLEPNKRIRVYVKQGKIFFCRMGTE
ncbi:MAG: tRNA lysidine(34) synthetase TilS [Clostridiales bacterium]|nr:tRNA lysidine(34) synthetase TilS [Clostridiales bacterium]